MLEHIAAVNAEEPHQMHQQHKQQRPGNRMLHMQKQPAHHAAEQQIHVGHMQNRL
ncbi:hypothetical protein SDC9_151308 [bioreactor metagenome]|uniref:Uncharacterized protein n=1 Tax=bioreactor metagenome TaxID=1076179 RepID=A0A645ES08_9ZZZZ